MSPFAQQLVVYAAIAVATGWLLRRWLGNKRSASASASACERCGSKATRRTPTRAVRPASLRVLP
ncbi:MAG: hypothetical protein AAF799_11435 [Myxococcota bacterium]